MEVPGIEPRTVHAKHVLCCSAAPSLPHVLTFRCLGQRGINTGKFFWEEGSALGAASTLALTLL